MVSEEQVVRILEAAEAAGTIPVGHLLVAPVGQV
jgi:hypothetical protein